MALTNITLQFSTSEAISLWRRSTWPNWSSLLIRRAGHSPFSHVDMVTPDNNLLGASNSPKAPVVTGNPCGVAIRPQHYQKFGYRRRMVIRTSKAAAIYSRAFSQLGKPFDNGFIWDFASARFPGYRNWRQTGMWACAELIVWAFEHEHYWPDSLHWPKNRISPTDLLILFQTDPHWTNKRTFWQPVAGLKLDKGET